MHALSVLVNPLQQQEQPPAAAEEAAVLVPAVPRARGSSFPSFLPRVKEREGEADARDR